MNIYEVYDRELERMHSLMRLYLSLPKGAASAGMPKIYERILSLQDKLVATIETSDREIQTKIAELAFTDSK
jgi:hypothetical protein